jgi:hypothetical protein
MTARRGALSLALAVVIALLVAWLWPGDHATPRATRAQILAFERVVDPLASQAGQVVQEGMKPAVTDLDHDHITSPGFIALEANGWLATLQDVRRNISKVSTPRTLVAARSPILASLGLYIQAAATFKAAALAPAAGRDAVIQRGIQQATQADHVFDQGAIVIQRARRAVGLGPSAYFPDPAANG